MERYTSLDLPQIKEKIAVRTAILEAREELLNEEVVFNPLLIKKKLSETKEALNILNEGYNLSFEGISNINELLDKADRNIILNGNELNKVLTFHNHCERIKKFFTHFDRELSLRDYSDSIFVNNVLNDEITKTVDTGGNVKENASPRLSSIYKELNQAENRLLERAHKFINSNSASLQELQVYTRNNRVVFLIKNMDKNRFGGFTYGSSASGLAYYVEPNAFVELNNKVESLEEEKSREIEVILQRLTYLVSSLSESYRHNFESLVKLNIIFAKAYYGVENHAVTAELGDKLELIDICHPLIDSKKVVSNTYHLDERYQGIVISGSNTGGKTVSLKLIGLSVILSYLGIPLIASEATVPLFDNVFVDIDDNQSIISSLSTFSAHITNIDSILIKATDKSLILIDELISGTDPKQAQAISLAIIERIEKIGSKFVITTHFDDIKNYAYEDDKILLSSVGFDLNELKPTYKYLENSVGSSNALEIASRYFSDPEIVQRSREILQESKTRQDELMDELSLEVAKNVQLNEELSRQKEETENIKKDLNDKLVSFEKEKARLKEDYQNKLQEEYESFKELVSEKLEEIKSKEDIKVIAEVKEKLPEIKEEENIAEEIKVGDSVVINDNEQHGKVLSISKDNATVDIRGITVKTKLSNLTKVQSVKIEKKAYKQRIRTSVRVSHELNLIGQRVEEALINLENYLDKAYAAGYSSVRIIHGFGTGALKNAVHEKLKKLKFVKSYKLADFDDGGSAITVVEFK